MGRDAPCSSFLCPPLLLPAPQLHQYKSLGDTDVCVPGTCNINLICTGTYQFCTFTRQQSRRGNV